MLYNRKKIMRLNRKEKVNIYVKFRKSISKFSIRMKVFLILERIMKNVLNFFKKRFIIVDRREDF